MTMNHLYDQYNDNTRKISHVLAFQVRCTEEQKDGLTTLG